MYREENIFIVGGVRTIECPEEVLAASGNGASAGFAARGGDSAFSTGEIPLLVDDNDARHIIREEGLESDES